MTTSDLAALAALAAGFATAAILTWPVVRRSGLGIAHPGVAWLAATGLFFGVGASVLAFTGETEGPALYVGAAVAAFGIGLWAADRFGLRHATTSAHGIGDGIVGTAAISGGAAALSAGSRKWAPALLAAVALGVVAPTLLSSGIPFLTSDITGSRAELVGLPVQLIRVALPGLASVLLFEGLRAAERRRRLGALLAIAVIGGFEVLLASRYLVLELGAALVLAWLIGGRRISVRAATALILATAIGFGGIQVLRAYDQAAGNELGFAAGRTVNRVVLIQPRTLAALQRVIPANEPFFLGATWIHRLGPLVGRNDIPNLGYWIYPEVVGGAQDTAGYAAPGLIGEAWANFGPAGVLIFVVLGVFAERLGTLIARRRSSAVDVTAAAMAILFLARTHALGLGGFALLFGLVCAWRVLAGPLAGLGSAARAVVRLRPAPEAAR